MGPYHHNNHGTINDPQLQAKLQEARVPDLDGEWELLLNVGSLVFVSFKREK